MKTAAKPLWRECCCACVMAATTVICKTVNMAAVKFGPHLKELRILLCQKSKSSQGVREFIESQYVPIKLTNPTFPVLVRECSDIEPRLFARYEFGKESCVPLANLKCDEILQKVKQLASAKP